MDIIPNKKSTLLYQKGDQKLKGVIDLRCFADGKRKQEDVNNKKNNIVSEIIKREDITAQAKPRIKIDKTNKQNSFYKKIKLPSFLISNSLKKSFSFFIIMILLVPAIIFSLSFVQKSVE